MQHCVIVLNTVGYHSTVLNTAQYNSALVSIAQYYPPLSARLNKYISSFLDQQKMYRAMVQSSFGTTWCANKQANASVETATTQIGSLAFHLMVRGKSSPAVPYVPAPRFGSGFSSSTGASCEPPNDISVTEPYTPVNDTVLIKIQHFVEMSNAT